MKPMKHRDLTRRLRKAGATPTRHGRHDVWTCPCGKHTTAVPNHGPGSDVSAGVLRNIIRDLACLPKGAIQ